MFDADWIRAQNRIEYPYALAEALAYKFSSLRWGSRCHSIAAEAHKFSLLKAGLLDRAWCRLLVINGGFDFPDRGQPDCPTKDVNKDLIVRGYRSHLGNPGAEEIIYRWIDDAVASGR
jgi:hypothetical protein